MCGEGGMYAPVHTYNNSKHNLIKKKKAKLSSQSPSVCSSSLHSLTRPYMAQVLEQPLCLGMRRQWAQSLGSEVVCFAQMHWGTPSFFSFVPHLAGAVKLSVFRVGSLLARRTRFNSAGKTREPAFQVSSQVKPMF